MTIKIRILHIILFELCALIIVTPLSALILHTPMHHMLALTVMVSIIASIWNFTFNLLFDKVETALGATRAKRGPILRVFHTCLFEAVLLILTVPLIAYWLGLSIIHAFIIDIGFVLFFLLYAYFFNWGFDYVYYHLINNSTQKKLSS